MMKNNVVDENDDAADYCCCCYYDWMMLLVFVPVVKVEVIFVGAEMRTFQCFQWILLP
jgi:hypothetical protein